MYAAQMRKMRKEHILLLLLFPGLIPGCINPSDRSQAIPLNSAIKSGGIIDVHTHILPGGMTLDQLIQNMDREGIDRMVIMESPADIEKGINQSEFGIPEAAEKYPDRFTALYGGEAITMLYSAAARGNYSAAEEERYSSLLEEAISSGRYRGFGEIALLHFVDDENGTNLTVAGDHAWMFLMSDIAARYDVPIDIHMESTDESIASFEELLDHNNRTRIIWEHAGRSNTGKTTPQLLRQLMEKHPNLYSAIKLRNPKTPERKMVRILDEEGNVTEDWMALFRDFPDRFMIGSDIKPGEKDDEFRRIKDHRKLLQQLPPEILSKIERENAIKMYNIEQ